MALRDAINHIILAKKLIEQEDYGDYGSGLCLENDKALFPLSISVSLDEIKKALSMIVLRGAE